MLPDKTFFALAKGHVAKICLCDGLVYLITLTAEASYLIILTLTELKFNSTRKFSIGILLDSNSEPIIDITAELIDFCFKVVDRR